MMMPAQLPFDRQDVVEFNEARQRLVTSFLKEVRSQAQLTTAADIGCGLGHFAKFLADLDFRVTAVDGRAENTAEGKRRFPEVTFLTADAESLPASEMGTFDLVLCFGLLYHLENPFRAMRFLRQLTGKILVIESMCAPGETASMELLDEYESDDQGLNYVAFYPTESCLIKMLYRSGFPRVYGLPSLPDHEFYRATFSHQRRRTMLVASTQDLRAQDLRLLPEPKRSWDIWLTRFASWRMKFGLARDSLRGSRRPRNSAGQR
jgi:SAM-dependent methyltransferase